MCANESIDAAWYQPTYSWLIYQTQQQLLDEGLRGRKTMEAFDGTIKWCEMGGSRDTTRAQGEALGRHLFPHFYVASLCQY
jgi:hypothetical protein